MRPTHLASTLVFALLLGAPPALAVDYVNDPLTDPAFSGRGVRGGAFSAGGWTTTGDTDAVWYEIPDALESGAVEYTVSGLSLSTNLTGNDHDLLAVYQAPDGLGEPIDYLPGFRNNDFKAFIRIFGTQEIGRPGAMKLELATCPQGPPWYHDTCDPSCGQDLIAYGRNSQNDLGWDPATEYRMVLAWGGGMMTFSRNGELLGTVNYSGTYAPQPLRVRLGSPRHSSGSTQTMPVGITIKDVLISGTPGTRTPYCGEVVTPSDAGVSEDARPGLTTEVAAIEDVTAASWEPGVFPDPNDLNVEGNVDGTPGAIVYLKFPAIGPVQHAELHLHTQAFGSAAGVSGQACALATDMWSESLLTWATRPAHGACVGLSRSVDSDLDVAWDVTSIVPPSGGVSTAALTFAIVSTDPDGVHYFSKESGDPFTRPRLVFEPAPSPDASVFFPDAASEDAEAPSSDAASADAGTALDAGADRDAATVDAGVDDLGHTTEDAGLVKNSLGSCGCSTASTARTDSTIPGALLALALLMPTVRKNTALERRRSPR